MSPLLNTLQALEVELHHPGVRCSLQRLEGLLHPQFHEVGRSGQQYARATVIEHLAALQVQPAVVSDRFDVVEVVPDVVLLTYRSAHAHSDGRLTGHTHRSSLWVRGPDGWQLRYHQGTPAASAW